MKIHDSGYPEWFDRMTSMSSVEPEKSSNMKPVGAIGAPESRNKLGMLIVLSL